MEVYFIEQNESGRYQLVVYGNFDTYEDAEEYAKNNDLIVTKKR